MFNSYNVKTGGNDEIIAEIVREKDYYLHTVEEEEE